VRRLPAFGRLRKHGRGGFEGINMAKINKQNRKRIIAGVIAGSLALIFILGMILPFLIR